MALRDPCSPPSSSREGRGVPLENYLFHVSGPTSLALLEKMAGECLPDATPIGTQVAVHWGDHGGAIKEVRATVERYRYLDLPRNSDVDVSKLST